MFLLLWVKRDRVLGVCLMLSIVFMPEYVKYNYNLLQKVCWLSPFNSWEENICFVVVNVGFPRCFDKFVYLLLNVCLEIERWVEPFFYYLFFYFIYFCQFFIFFLFLFFICDLPLGLRSTPNRIAFLFVLPGVVLDLHMQLAHASERKRVGLELLLNQCYALTFYFCSTVFRICNFQNRQE